MYVYCFVERLVIYVVGGLVFRVVWVYLDRFGGMGRGFEGYLVMLICFFGINILGIVYLMKNFILKIY